ncbi:M16 family metallopeptidase [Pseudoduganella aquatica]|uniref:Insulinase family protein n=1 Tax=Pseudoduganella aquatica TaxID=2660641 RepID=A0A7X4KQ32_9BURK|nr:pitrilysin family protein [Pseudoduganella aquatica]MYN10918.1 insulinase family protein [Pseudoduganella aquatica]
MKKLILAVAISTLCAPVLHAQTAAPAASPVPAYGADKPLPVPKIARKTLANGLEVWVVPRTGLPRVDFVLAVRGAGYAADDAQHPAFASLLANLLNEGTTKRSSRAVAEAAQGMGGSVGAGTSNDGITVYGNALASSAAPMAALLAEVAREPSFPDAEVQLAKTNALQALKAAEARPSFRAERAISRVVYGDHPYGRTTATAEAITSVDAALLRAEHAKRFRPERSLLVITGRIKEADAMKLAEAAFGSWKSTGPALPDTPAAAAAMPPQRLLLERAGSVQSTLRLGRPGTAASVEDYVPLRLASTILGGGFSSRVNLNLREEKGYTYGASAGARMSRNGGAIIGGADVRNEVTGAALGEYFKEYRKLGTELVGDEELSMNKRYVAGTYLVTNQLQGAVAGTLANNWLVGLPPETLGSFVPKIQKVSAEQVRDMGKKYFSPETQSIVVVGDKAAVAEQLKEFGEFTVTDR